ncbi:BrnT family toxin [Methyloversatilis sp.]|uniref:BrnT family toxin n=1 Tax=Methyloversatilis sp. TaxID=2569862 RepID=UPI003524D998
MGARHSHPYGETEERWFTVGQTRPGKLLAVSHTFVMTGPDRAQVRIISAREATRFERQQYEDER